MHTLTAVLLVLATAPGAARRVPAAPGRDLLAASGPCADTARVPDVLIADFEGSDYGEWATAGEAFGSGPARGALPGQMRVSGYLGRGLVNSFRGGDASTGTLTSPPFTIERRYLNFLVGGGGYPGETCIDLLVAGRTVRTATGPNAAPGGSERLDWHSWDVAELLGKTAVIRVTDRRTGGWGHINIDHIVQSDRRLEAQPASREITVQRRYLHLPVENEAPRRRLRFVLDGETVREFEIELAGGEPDFWVFSDVSRFRGRRLEIAADRIPPGSRGLVSIVQSDQDPGARELYREKYRPQFHFSPRRGWTNDPNGLVYLDGEYHLYFQHNPYGREWGNMHWGHAVSPDLVHWTELPVALYPRRFGDWCFSGSAVVDRGDTAGFKKGTPDPAGVMVAAYTSTGRGECIAYSHDRGRTFTECEGNPVVRHQGRDPKVIWYAPGRHWVMAVYDEREGSRGIAFYTSPDLKHWSFESRADGYYECPEIFELPVGGDPRNTRWVLHGADGAYSLGRFDGKVFTPEGGKHRFNWGNCFYASQTFNGVPAEDGRRIQIAWGRTGHPSMPFNQQMNFPVTLTLRPAEEGIRLFAEPVREITRLHARGRRWPPFALEEGTYPLEGLAGDLFHIQAQLVPGAATALGIEIRTTRVSYEVPRGELSCGELTAPLRPEEGAIRLEILADRLSLEIFANRGRVYMPVSVLPPGDNRTLALFARGGPARVQTLAVYELRSAWR